MKPLDPEQGISRQLTGANDSNGEASCRSIWSRIGSSLGLVTILAAAQPSQASVVTGSVYVDVSQANYPALFEIRTDRENAFLVGYFLWDDFYPVVGADFKSDGTLRAIETATPDLLTVFTFDLEGGKLVFEDGSTMALSKIAQKVGQGSSSAEPKLRTQKRGSNLELTWDATRGQSYSLESKARVNEPWQSVEVITATSDIGQWQTPLAGAESHRFYRITKPVIINGVTLTADDIVAFEETYGTAPVPGNYWYDPVSGLYGAEGYAAYGQMYPGHNLPGPRQDASIGNTGVLLNGRELPLSEWWIWSLLLRTAIPSGSYWLDGGGNYGTGPSPSLWTLAGNLYALGRQNNYQPGQGGSPSGDGDNFWSSQYAAGNSSGGAGYISLPGGESVTWGM